MSVCPCPEIGLLFYLPFTPGPLSQRNRPPQGLALTWVAWKRQRASGAQQEGKSSEEQEAGPRGHTWFRRES